MLNDCFSEEIGSTEIFSAGILFIGKDNHMFFLIMSGTARRFFLTISGTAFIKDNHE